MSLDRSKRLGGLALAAALLVAACSAIRRDAAPSARQAPPPPAPPHPAPPHRARAPARAESTAAGDAADRPDRRRPAAGRRGDVPGPAVHVLVRDLQRREPEHQDRLPGHRLRWRDQGHHRPDRRLRRLGRRHEGRGDRRPEAGREDPPRADRARRGRGHLQRAGRDGDQPRRRHDRRPVRGHDQELERPEDRRAQLGRDPARPPRDRRPSLRRLRHDQRLHHVPRHRQRRLARQRRGGQGGPVADGHRCPGQ